MELALKSLVVGYGVPPMVLRADNNQALDDLVSTINNYPPEISVERTNLQVFPLNDGRHAFTYELLFSYNRNDYPVREIDGIIKKWVPKIETAMEEYLKAKSIPYAKL